MLSSPTQRVGQSGSALSSPPASCIGQTLSQSKGRPDQGPAYELAERLSATANSPGNALAARFPGNVSRGSLAVR